MTSSALLSISPSGALASVSSEKSARYLEVRQLTERLVEPLSDEVMQLQTMDDVSPAKWHLAHTTWFFETFILCEYLSGYQRLNESYNYLFNSYYNGIGDQYPRAKRGLLDKPCVEEVFEYRAYVDKYILNLLEGSNTEIFALIDLGINHEQQHQELLLTDIKYSLYRSESPSGYLDLKAPASTTLPALTWCDFEEGLYEVGCAGNGFSYDNEMPRHKVYVYPFSLASRLVTNGEYLEFINDAGYSTPSLWLSDGWTYVQEKKKNSPLYWQKNDNSWSHYTLSGMQSIELSQPVTHLSYYEACAFSVWAGKRLPTEVEWEVAASQHELREDNVLDMTVLNPKVGVGDGLIQMFGGVWEWTSSNYSAYPGFKPFEGVAGEYNGKFMCSQYVLRGGSCVTPRGHIRKSYRNFFYAHQAWQFTGLRLASD